MTFLALVSFFTSVLLLEKIFICAHIQPHPTQQWASWYLEEVIVCCTVNV